MAAWVGVLLVGGCGVVPNVRGSDCAQDGSCPEGFTCFPDFRCYEYAAIPPCAPPCYGAEPFCDQATLRCVECRSDGDCTAGFVCGLRQRCQPGCSAARPDCAPGQRCDAAIGACVMMGQGCTSDAVCTAPGLLRCDVRSGQCVSCLPDRDDCLPGTFCLEAGGRFRCVQGCDTAADCPSTGSAVTACCNHRCADVLTSNEHCGACGNPCQNNDSCCDGVCVDLTRSASHCGGCGRSCYLPNVAGVRCANSQCSNRGCEQYFGDCDGNLQSNGCEVNHSFSPLHCSSCGHSCPGQPHRPGVCVLLSCSASGPCEPGWGDCDAQHFNGCERPLTTTSDCGGCGAACPSGQTCSSGTCR